ncbi:MAG: hypothetical protein ACP5OK_08305 [Thermoprotei archaeon]
MQQNSKILKRAKEDFRLMIYLEPFLTKNAFEKSKKLIKYVNQSINGVIIETQNIVTFGLEYISKNLLPYIYGNDLLSVADYSTVSYINIDPSIFKEYGFDILIIDPLYVNSHFEKFMAVRNDTFAIIINSYRGHKRQLIRQASKVRGVDGFYVEGSSKSVAYVRKILDGFIIAREGPGGDVDVITVSLNDDIHVIIKKIENRLNKQRIKR